MMLFSLISWFPSSSHPSNPQLDWGNAVTQAPCKVIAIISSLNKGSREKRRRGHRLPSVAGRANGSNQVKHKAQCLARSCSPREAVAIDGNKSSRRVSCVSSVPQSCLETSILKGETKEEEKKHLTELRRLRAHAGSLHECPKHCWGRGQGTWPLSLDGAHSRKPLTCDCYTLLPVTAVWPWPQDTLSTRVLGVSLGERKAF